MMKMELERRKLGAIVALCILGGLLVGSIATYAALQWTYKITATVTIKSVGVNVYSDPACTIPLVTIDWGMMEPGQSKNYSAYIKNESNVPVTMNMYAENWTPVNAKDFMAVTWSYDGRQIPVDGSLPVDFTLSIDGSISGIRDFSFEIWVVGSG
jgi:hypothetical protein